MRKIHEGRHLIAYGQVAIWDRQDDTSYPEPNGPLPWAGPKGLVVPAKSDGEITVLVYEGTGETPPEAPTFLTRATIAVGGQGLEVGNVTAASAADVDWPAGAAMVSAYYNGSTADDADVVAFVLSKAPAS